MRRLTLFALLMLFAFSVGIFAQRTYIIMPQQSQIAPAVTAEITRVAVETHSGIVYQFCVTFASGETMYFQNVQEIYDYLIPIQNSETARMLLLGRWLAQSPDASNTNVILGKTLTFDLSNVNPVRIQ